MDMESPLLPEVLSGPLDIPEAISSSISSFLLIDGSVALLSK